MFDLNKFYPLDFLVKHLGTCSLREVAFQSNLIPFIPRGKGNLFPSIRRKRQLNVLFPRMKKQFSFPMASSLKKLFRGYFFIHFIYGRKNKIGKRIKP